MIDLKMNQNIGLEKVIIIYDEQKETYSVLAQNPFSKNVDYLTVESAIKDGHTAMIVKRSYIRGLYDGADWERKNGKNEIYR